MTERPINQFDGEFAALQHSRKMESLINSRASEALSKLVDVADKLGVPGAGLFAKALKSGQTPVEKVVEQIETAAYREIARIWNHLNGQDERLESFRKRLGSQEAQTAYVSAILHGLRTSDPLKHARLGVLTVNSVFANDLGSETLDELMRAAVELTESDIRLLGKLYKSQKLILDNHASRPFSYQWYEQVGAAWEHEFSHSERDHLMLRGSLMRLRSLGMIAETGANLNGEFAKQHFGLLLEGRKFYERLQEIDASR